MVRPLLSSDRGAQPVLLPTDARDLLPADHAAWHYLAIVDELDLDAFHAFYRADGRGRPPYDPAMMLALLLYCAHKNIRTPRAIAAACHDDLGCRIITANRYPDDTTIDRFRRNHAVALQALLPQSIRLCDDAGLVDLDLIAGDATKVIANAAMTATIDETTLRERLARLTTLVADREPAWRASITEPTSDQLELFDPDASRLERGHGQAWRDLLRARAVLDTHQRALDHLLTHPGNAQADWETRLAADTARVQRCRQRLDTVTAEVTATHQAYTQRLATGQRPHGRPPVPPTEHAKVRTAAKALHTATARAQATAANPPTSKVNVTDPTSRIMPGKHGGFDQLFNVQAAACASQVILAIGRHDNANDKQALVGLLGAARANLDTLGITRPIGVAVFDSGYASTDNFTTDLPVQTLLVAVRREAQQAGRDTSDPASIPEAWQPMADRLADETNRRAYRRRSAIIEPVFVQLFNHFGHDLTCRGDGVTTELHLWAASHNLAKLIRHRRKTRTPRPPG